MTAADRLNEIEARTNAATRGPWSHYGSWPFEVIGDALDPDGGTQVLITGIASHEEDSEFAANARTDIPALTAALRSVLRIHWSRGPYCNECGGQAPCSTVRGIATALGVTR